MGPRNWPTLHDPRTTTRFTNSRQNTYVSLLRSRSASRRSPNNHMATNSRRILLSRITNPRRRTMANRDGRCNHNPRRLRSDTSANIYIPRRNRKPTGSNSNIKRKHYIPGNTKTAHPIPHARGSWITMPTELGEPFAITWRGDPQQMLPPDVPLWHLFLDRYASTFERFFYNVRVGGPSFEGLKVDLEMAKCWYASTAKRIDAIGEKRNEIWIIEVASSPYLRAVGQCLSYKFLWEEDPKIKKPAKMILLCPYLDSDLTRILKHYKVTIITIEKPQKPTP